MFIFEKTDCPSSEKSNPINDKANWFTWSAQAEDFLDRWADEVECLDEPKLIFTSADKPYNYTFTLSPQLIKNNILVYQLDSFARSLLRIRVSEKIMLLTRLFESNFDGRSLHYLFSCLRDRLVTFEEDQMTALYPPLGLTNEGSSSPIIVDFPLHCDLYSPKL